MLGYRLRAGYRLHAGYRPCGQGSLLAEPLAVLSCAGDATELLHTLSSAGSIVEIKAACGDPDGRATANVPQRPRAS